MSILITQPAYLPWLGFIDKLLSCDVFVVLDTAQYCKNDFYNRNRIVGKNGQIIWLTVPVRSSGFPPLNAVSIDNSRDWRKKHLGSLQSCYGQAPYFDRYWLEIKEVLSRDWQSLIDLQMAFIRKLMDWFEVHPQLVMASELPVKSDDRNLKLVEICQMFGATTYVSGAGARCYLDESLFDRVGIKVEWREWEGFPYAQPVREFVPQLSAIDFLMNCNPAVMRQFVASSWEGKERVYQMYRNLNKRM